MSRRKKSPPPDSKRYWHLSLRERRMLVQGLTDSLTMTGTEVPESDEDHDDLEARQSEIEALRWKLATVSQRKEFRKPDA